MTVAQLCSSQRHDTAGENSKTAWKIVKLCEKGKALRDGAIHYVALIRKDRDTDYGVDIPDLPGCCASGKTEEEAKENFDEALKLHLETIRENANFSLP